MSEQKEEVNVKPKEIRIQYEPYEKYLTRILLSMNDKLDKIEKAQQVIKERITFESQNKTNK